LGLRYSSLGRHRPGRGVLKVFSFLLLVRVNEESTKCFLLGVWRPSLIRGGVWGSIKSHTCESDTLNLSKLVRCWWPEFIINIKKKLYSFNFLLQSYTRAKNAHLHLWQSLWGRFHLYYKYLDLHLSKRRKVFCLYSVPVE